MSRVEASPEAVDFVRAHGGRVFVWVDDAGLKHVKARPPARPVEFVQIPGAPFELNVDASLVEPRRWVIVLRRLPFKHLDALWNGSEPYAFQPTKWY